MKKFLGITAPFLAAVALLAPACSGTEVRSQSGGPCSLSSGDDPHYICDPSKDLVCINTTATAPGKNPAYFCRVACEVNHGDCQPLEVCCPGNIHGKTYDKMRGCTPSNRCDLPPGGSGKDADADLMSGADGST